MHPLIPGSVQFGLYLSTPPRSGVAAVAPPAAQPPAADLRGPPVPGSPWFSLAASPPAPPVAPVVPASSPQAKPFLSRFVREGEGEDRRLARITEHLMVLVNSLVAQGIVRQTGPASFTVVPPASGVVSSFDGRTGAVTLTGGDVTTALGYRPAQPLAMGQAVAAGQANSVLYLDATATLAQKNPGLTYDGNTFTVSRAGIGLSFNPPDAAVAVNPTPATAADQFQSSPGIRVSGQAWHTTNLVSNQIDFRQYLFCNSGSPPLGIYRFEGQVAGGGYVTLMDIRTSGSNAVNYYASGGGGTISMTLSTNAQLVVNSGAAGTSEGVTFNHNGVNEANIQVASGQLTIQTNATVPIRFLAAGSFEAIFIDTSGLVGMGKTSSIGAKLHIIAPATGTKVLIVEGIASQTGQLFQLRGASSTTSSREQAEIDTAWVDNTDASRKAKMILRVWDTAARDAVVISATGGSCTVVFQVSPSSPGAGTGSEQWGASAVAGSNFSLAVGNAATASGATNCTAVGWSATASGTQSLAVGRNAQATATQSMAIGDNVTANHTCAMAIGSGSTAGEVDAVAVGPLASATGLYSLCFGRGASDGGFNGCIVFGTNTTATAASQFRVGSDTIPDDRINDVVVVGRNTGQFRYQLDTSTSNRDTVTWAVSWVDSTDATRKARLTLSAWDTAAREGMRIEGDGTQALVSFYGVAAVARQTASADATDLASVITLANNLKAILKNVGIAQ